MQFFLFGGGSIFSVCVAQMEYIIRQSACILRLFNLCILSADVTTDGKFGRLLLALTRMLKIIEYIIEH